MVRWLSDDELRAWIRLVSVCELLPATLDSQLRRDAGLSHYEYFVLVRLSDAPDQTLRMSTLAARTNATLPRLSHVIARLEQQGLVERAPCPEDARATNARLTSRGQDKAAQAAPGHLDTVRRQVIDALSAQQLHELSDIAEAILHRLDPQDRLGIKELNQTEVSPSHVTHPDA
jgi:DNA-binding MarR family transcriptional regulator